MYRVPPVHPPYPLVTLTRNNIILLKDGLDNSINYINTCISYLQNVIELLSLLRLWISQYLP